MREGSEDKTVDERVNEITREAVDEIDGLEELMNSGPVFDGKADEHIRPWEIFLELVEFAGKREHKRGYFAGLDRGREQARERDQGARPSVDVPRPEVEERTDGESGRHGTGHQPTKRAPNGLKPPRITTVVHTPAPTSGSAMPVGGTGVRDSKADRLLESLRTVDRFLAGVDQGDYRAINWQRIESAKQAARSAIKRAESGK